jgi:hypothetical protein
MKTLKRKLKSGIVVYAFAAVRKRLTKVSLKLTGAAEFIGANAR